MTAPYSLSDGIRERFKDEFPNTTQAADMENYAFENDDATALMNAEETVVMLDKSIEKFGMIVFSNVDTEPSYRCIETATVDDTKRSVVKIIIDEEGAQSCTYYYQKRYLDAIANVIETNGQYVRDRIRSQWAMWRGTYPCVVESKDHWFIVSPFVK